MGRLPELFGHAFSRRMCGLLLVALLGGCASSYRVTVDSLAKPDANAVSYVLRNANPSVGEDTAGYREAAGYVKTALLGRGLYEAPAKVVPDMIIELDCGVGPPRIQSRVIMEPVYSSSPPRIVERREGVDGEGRGIYVPTRETKPPTLRARTIVTKTYEKYIRLTARENKPSTEGHPIPEIWTVDVTSEGESKDLRKHLPILVAASIDYIGKDTHGQKSIRIKDSDSDVVFVKKGL